MKTMRLFASVIVAVCAQAVFAGELEDVSSRLKQLYPATKFKQISQTPIPGIYEAVMGKNVAYVDPSGRYFLFGHLYDMKEQKDLTEDKLPNAEENDKVSIDRLPLTNAIKTVKGNGQAKLIVFSDPDCPYCRRLESELTKVTDVTIYTFLFPLEMHPEAKGKAVSVWCSEDQSKAWHDLMLSGARPSSICNTSVIEQNIALAQSMNIRGTPTLIFEDGTLVPGAMSSDRISAALSNGRTSK